MKTRAIGTGGALLALFALGACPDSTTGGLTQGEPETGFTLPDGRAAGEVAPPDSQVDAGDGDAGGVDVIAGCVNASDCPASADGCLIPVCDQGVCGEVPAPSGAPCSDGDACTVGSVCQQGACGGGTDICGDCASDPEGTPCSDGNACTTGDTCQSGACVAGPATVCPQGGACSESVCDPIKGCALVDVDEGTQCNDGNPCSQDDTCSQGVCVGGANSCSCESDDDCDAFESGVCGAQLGCQSGQCEPVAQAPACPQPSDPCLEAVCNDPVGCQEQPVADGTPCAVGSGCGPSSCQAGVCVAPEDPCDDGNPCTADSCTGGECVNEGTGGSCDDGDPCTEDDYCTAAGECSAGTGVCGCESDAQCQGAGFDACLGQWSCVDGNCQPGDPVDCSNLDGPCQVGMCSDGACTAAAAQDGEACGGGSGCVGSGTCLAGACQGGAPVDCDDSNPCTNDGCDPATGCTHTFNAAPCDDGNACTTGDTCSQGQCVASGVLDCDAAIGCQVGQCDPEQGCTTVAAADGTACDDGDECTDQDTCLQGTCGGAAVCDCTTDADCPDDGDACNGVPVCNADSKCEVDPQTVVTCGQDDNACTVATCDPSNGTCVTTNVAPGTACDGGPCTTDGSCAEGSCQAAGVVCDDGSPCTTDSCDPQTGLCIAVAADGAACDDGDPCTLGDSCAAGGCVGGAPNDCDDGDACTADSCLPGVGCTSVSSCDDGNPCTDDSCDSTGVGCVNTPVDCSTGDACSVGACNPAAGGCVIENVPDGGFCDDGDACTTGEVCAGGVCGGGGQSTCDDGNPCTKDECAGGVCSNVDDDGVACDDGNDCTQEDLCASGVCSGIAKTCDDGDPCTADSCNGGVCQSVTIPGCGIDPQCDDAPNGSACDDGDPSTVADMCLVGTCAGYSVVVAPGTTGATNQRFTRVNHYAGDWFIGRQQFGNSFPQNYAGTILNANNPSNLSPAAGGQTGQDFFRDIHNGYALTYFGQLHVRNGGGTWSNNSPLSQALATSGGGDNMRQLWSYENSFGRVVWVAGGTAGNAIIRRCSNPFGFATCDDQSLPSVPLSSWVPRAMRGHVSCGALGFCSPNLVMAGDATFNGGLYNSVFGNEGGDQNTWDYEYQDLYSGPSEVNDIAGDGNGNYLMVGTQGFMRFRGTGANVSNSWSNTVADQAGMTLNGVWAGAGAWIVVATRDVANGFREFVLMAAAQGTDLSDSDSWTRYSLGFDAQAAAGILDVWGTETGAVRGVGAIYGQSNATQPTQWVRNP